VAAAANSGIDVHAKYTHNTHIHTYMQLHTRNHTHTHTSTHKLTYYTHTHIPYAHVRTHTHAHKIFSIGTQTHVIDASVLSFVTCGVVCFNTCMFLFVSLCTGTRMCLPHSFPFYFSPCLQLFRLNLAHPPLALKPNIFMI